MQPTARGAGTSVYSLYIGSAGGNVDEIGALCGNTFDAGMSQLGGLEWNGYSKFPNTFFKKMYDVGFRLVMKLTMHSFST